MLTFKLHPDALTQPAILIVLHAPQTQADLSQCEVTFSDYPPFPPIIGDDPLQALENALHFVRTLLRQSGRQWYWPDGRPYLDLEWQLKP